MIGSHIDVQRVYHDSRMPRRIWHERYVRRTLGWGFLIGAQVLSAQGLIQRPHSEETPNPCNRCGRAEMPHGSRPLHGRCRGGASLRVASAAVE